MRFWVKSNTVSVGNRRSCLGRNGRTGAFLKYPASSGSDATDSTSGGLVAGDR